MGEMADYLIEQELDAWDFNEDEWSTTKTCRKCGETGLYWDNDGITKSGWSLYKDGVRHSCIMREKK